MSNNETGNSKTRQTDTAAKTVVLKSHNDLKVTVTDSRDATFLRLADNFLLRSAEIQKDPYRRKPRLF